MVDVGDNVKKYKVGWTGKKGGWAAYLFFMKGPSQAYWV